MALAVIKMLAHLGLKHGKQLGRMQLERKFYTLQLKLRPSLVKLQVAKFLNVREFTPLKKVGKWGVFGTPNVVVALILRSTFLHLPSKM
jgi:lipoate synthase